MQTTIGGPVRISGIGLHTGCRVTVELQPAPVDSGIVFRRVDLQDFEIRAHRRHVSRVVLATTLMKRGVMLSTVEHLLSALYGLAIDNLYIDIDSLEVPILDGSALPFVEMVREAGRVEQSAQRTFLKVEKEVQIEDGEKFIRIEPAFDFGVSYEIDFAHPAIGRQQIHLRVTPETYARRIAFARTFGFLSEVKKLRAGNLIRGGSLENSIVLNDTGIMNDGLRAGDEFVRHKVLDLIGDVSLCGHPLIGHIKAYKAGHALHTALATELVRSPALCTKISELELATTA
ncbi:MAG: UDP-3-O-acyl-N-acetylglucosamine deacetylase [Acidobacteriota bacterium]